MYKVKSDTEYIFYEVGVTNGFCTCPKQKLGAFSKRQASIYHYYEINVLNLSAINTDSRYLLAKLAFGENMCDKSFYMSLTSEPKIIRNNTILQEYIDLHKQNNNVPHCSTTQTIIDDNCTNSIGNNSAHEYTQQILKNIIIQLQLQYLLNVWTD